MPWAFRRLLTGRIANMLADIGQGALDAIVTPRRILPGEVQDEVDNHLTDPGSADRVAFVGVVPFPGDQFPMSAQNRVGGHDGSKFQECLPAQGLTFDRQKAPVFVREQDAFPAELLQQRLDLGVLELDDLLLPLIDPARKGD